MAWLPFSAAKSSPASRAGSFWDVQRGAAAPFHWSGGVSDRKNTRRKPVHRPLIRGHVWPMTGVNPSIFRLFVIPFS
jgi:hypothetical protein